MAKIKRNRRRQLRALNAKQKAYQARLNGAKGWRSKTRAENRARGVAL